MNKYTSAFFIVAIGLFAVTGLPDQAAAEESSGSVTLEPAKFVSVKGDENKFRAHHWMNGGYSGGIKSLEFKKEYDNGTLLEFEGHSIPAENDNGVRIHVTSEDIGEWILKYSSFRKYYDDSGGYYYPFSTLQSTDGQQDLRLDIEDLFFSYSPNLAMDNLGLTFFYERKTKNGMKSRLTWAEAREGSTQREITPSSQSIDEEVNTFGLKEETKIAGFNVEAEQKYELMDTHLIRHENWISTNSSASQNKRRRQDQYPETQLFTAMFKGDKWYDDDNAYLNFAYRYNSLTNSELENLIETNNAGVPTTFSFGKSAVNALADNEVDEHVLIGHYMKNMNEHLRLSAKFKNRLLKRDGESTYPQDTSPTNPDGVIDQTDYANSTNKALNFAQSLGFKYSGFSKASVYGEVETEQLRNTIKEEQFNDQFLNWERRTKAKTQKTTWTLGSRYVANRFLSFTAQARHKQENTDYDDKVETSGAINSAFFDSLKIASDEFTTKATWKPLDWMRHAFRYQLDYKKYTSRVQSLDDQDSRWDSQTFTYDVFIQAMRDILLNFSYSHQNSKVSTPATASSDAAAVAGFNADYNNFLLSASYTPNDEMTFTGAFGMTLTDNFDDFTSSALPLGTHFSSKNAEITFKWQPKDKNWSVEPHYAYYDYDTSSVSEFGNYIAHVGWLDFNFHW